VWGSEYLLLDNRVKIRRCARLHTIEVIKDVAVDIDECDPELKKYGKVTSALGKCVIA